MQNKINRLLTLKNFFNIQSANNNIVHYSLTEPSKVILHNIYEKWFSSIWQKTDKHFPVFLNSSIIDIKNKNTVPMGYIHNSLYDHDSEPLLKHNTNEFLPHQVSRLLLNVILPQSDIMQYFLQWQRYRKFWWSTISTTPGLFSLSDIKYAENGTEVHVLAQFPWGEQTVENITITTLQQKLAKKAVGKLESSMTLEGALFTILFDGLLNCTKEGYLRLHRNMAPYKLSFTLDDNNAKERLNDLATLLDHVMDSNKISTWLPDFSLPLETQLKECREIGIAYTAIITQDTLKNGIFNLMNSSTMLKEQVHVADFESYAKLLSSF